MRKIHGKTWPVHGGTRAKTERKQKTTKKRVPRVPSGCHTDSDSAEEPDLDPI
jgi:hypothetical protein